LVGEAQRCFVLRGIKRRGMTKGKGGSRKTRKIVRMPATKFPKLQKRLRQRPLQPGMTLRKGKAV
jgi:hypothetical protein